MKLWVVLCFLILEAIFFLLVIALILSLIGAP